MSGMDILVNALVKATGLDIAALKTQAEAYIKTFEDQAKLLNSQMHLISLRLENIERALHIEKTSASPIEVHTDTQQ